MLLLLLLLLGLLLLLILSLLLLYYQYVVKNDTMSQRPRNVIKLLALCKELSENQMGPILKMQ